MGSYLPKFPHEYIESDPHDDPLGHALYLSQGAYCGTLLKRDEYVTKVREIKDRRATGILGERGERMELERLAREFGESIAAEYGPRLKKARATADEVRASLTAPKVKASANYDEAVERGLRRDRVIRRYETLPPDQQRRFLESADRETLRTLAAEPGLLSEPIIARINVNTLRGNPQFPAYERLVGKHLVDGTTDPLTSALDVAEYVVAGAKAWALEVAGIAPSNADRLKDAGIDTKGERIRLTEEQSKDPELFRAVREAAVEAGKSIEVVGPEGAGSYAPTNDGQG